MRKLNQMNWQYFNNKNKWETESMWATFLACDETTYNIEITEYFKLHRTRSNSTKNL